MGERMVRLAEQTRAAPALPVQPPAAAPGRDEARPAAATSARWTDAEDRMLLEQCARIH